MTSISIFNVIASEFDINLGPSIRSQYPHEISGDLPFFAELLLPDQIHNRSEDWTVVILRRDGVNYSYSCDKSSNENLYVLNVVNVRHDEKVHRKTVIKGIAISTTCQCFHMFKPLLLFGLDELFQISNTDPHKDSKTQSVLKAIYDSVNCAKISIPSLSLESKLLINSVMEFPVKSYSSNRSFVTKLFKSKCSDAISVKSGGIFEVFVNYMSFKIPLRIPGFQLPDIIGDFSINTFLEAFLKSSLVYHQGLPELTIYGQDTPPIIVLINALLTQKKVFFLGNRCSGYSICEFVFAALALVSNGVVSGLVDRTFPYLDLSKYDFIEAQSWFLAGTANPTFKAHDKLWDVLYDMETNELVLTTSHVDDQVLSSPDTWYSAESNSRINEELQSPSSIYSGFSSILNNVVGNVSETPKSPQFSSIINPVPYIQEDANFLSLLNDLVDGKHDEDTILLAFRQHINSIMKIFVSAKHHLVAEARPALRDRSVSDSSGRHIVAQETRRHGSISETHRHGSISETMNSPRFSGFSEKEDENLRYSKNESIMSFTTNNTFSTVFTSKHSSVTTNDSGFKNDNKMVWAKNSKSPNKRPELSIRTSFTPTPPPSGNKPVVEKDEGYFWYSKAKKSQDIKTYYVVYKNFQQNSLQYTLVEEKIDLMYQLCQLQAGNSLSVVKTEQICTQIFNYIAGEGEPSDKAIERFLIAAYLAPVNEEKNLGNCKILEPLLIGLYHVSPKVRVLTTEILGLVQKNFLGRLILKNTLNPFFKLGLEGNIAAMGSLKKAEMAMEKRSELEEPEIRTFNDIYSVAVDTNEGM